MVLQELQLCAQVLLCRVENQSVLVMLAYYVNTWVMVAGGVQHKRERDEPPKCGNEPVQAKLK